MLLAESELARFCGITFALVAMLAFLAIVVLPWLRQRDSLDNTDEKEDDP